MLKVCREPRGEGSSGRCAHFKGGGGGEGERETDRQRQLEMVQNDRLFAALSIPACHPRINTGYTAFQIKFRVHFCTQKLLRLLQSFYS